MSPDRHPLSIEVTRNRTLSHCKQPVLEDYEKMRGDQQDQPQNLAMTKTPKTARMRSKSMLVDQLTGGPGPRDMLTILYYLRPCEEKGFQPAS